MSDKDNQYTDLYIVQILDQLNAKHQINGEELVLSQRYKLPSRQWTLTVNFQERNKHKKTGESIV
jgi:hypothetical protein